MDDPRLAVVPVGRLITIRAIATLLGVQRETVDLWRSRDKQGRAQATPMPEPLLPRPGVDVGNREPYFDRDEIVAWALSTGRLKPKAKPREIPVAP